MVDIRDINEAIKYYEEKAKELREKPFIEKMNIEDIATCEECAEENEQLAEWLKELKEWRIRRPVCTFGGEDGYVVYKKLKDHVEY